MDFAKVQRVGKKLNLMETCHIVFCVLDWLLTIRTRGGAAEERHRRKMRRWDMLLVVPAGVEVHEFPLNPCSSDVACVWGS